MDKKYKHMGMGMSMGKKYKSMHMEKKYKGSQGSKEAKGFNFMDNSVSPTTHQVDHFAGDLGSMKLKPSENKGYPSEAWGHQYG